MRFLYTFIILSCFSMAQAQLSVVSTSPAHGSTNVPLSTTFSVTFSAALDTTYPFSGEYGFFWNFDSYSGRRFSADRRTVTFDVVLSPGSMYVVAMYYARALGGGNLQVPYTIVFSTGPSLGSYTVSGNVLSGSSGVSPAYALVLLSTTPVQQGQPHPVTGAVASVTGAYTLPYVTNGTYYPVAAKDANGDGELDPSSGDVIAIGDPLTVSNGSVSGLNLTFITTTALTYAQGVPVADSISATLPPDKTLRRIQGWEVDSLGRTNSWQFSYLRNSLTSGYRIEVGSFERRVDTLDAQEVDWLRFARPLTNPGSAANSSVFIGNVENAGGRQFRQQDPGGNLTFNCEVNVGDLRNTYFGMIIPDTSQNYWGAFYSWGYDSTNYWVPVHWMMFIGNYSTGEILVVNDVKNGDNELPGSSFRLSQNYPNPFNPTTTIEYQIPANGFVTLKVYDLLGREVAMLVSEEQKANHYTIPFNGNNLPSGVYFYRLQAGSFSDTRSFVLMK